jgi:beta-lactamase superfamily II metal-dependent hydrolase
MAGGVGAGGESGNDGGVAGGGAGPDGGAGGGTTNPEGELHIYLVDVEGGQATVLRYPDGTVMLVDAGIPGARDPGRIADVLTNEVGTDRIDYLLTTHYDGDHVGGVPDVAEQFEVGTFLDHGDMQAPQNYIQATMAGARQIIEAGDRLDIGAVGLDFVASARTLIDQPLPGAGSENPHCEAATVKPGDDENSASVGFMLHFGEFDFINLADLLWNLEHELVCPSNLLGEVELYLTTHHGLDRSGATQLVRALNPVAAVMNNGPRKGGGGETWETLSLAPGSDDVWQLHLNVQAPEDENAAEDQLANIEEGNQDQAHFLLVTASGDGTFTIENPRNGFSKDYPRR